MAPSGGRSELGEHVALDRAVRGGAAGHHADDAVDELVALGLLGLEGEEVLDRPGCGRALAMASLRSRALTVMIGATTGRRKSKRLAASRSAHIALGAAGDRDHAGAADLGQAERLHQVDERIQLDRTRR